MKLVRVLTEVDYYTQVSKELENNVITQESSRFQKNIDRRRRLIQSIKDILRDRRKNTILFDYPMETEYPGEIKEVHAALKRSYVPLLVELYYMLNLENENYTDCVNIMSFILDTESEESKQPHSFQRMDVDGGVLLSLKPYMDLKSLNKLNSDLSDLIVGLVLK